MIKTRFGACAVCVAALATSFAATAVADDYVMYHNKDARTIVLDTSRIAVFDEPGASPEMVQKNVKSNVGLLGDIDRRTVPIAGWGLCDVPEAQRENASVEQLILQLVRRQQHTFVAPVFFDDFGGPLIPTRDIFVRFNDDVALVDAERVLADSQAGTIIARDYGGFAGLYRLRSDSRSGFEVIEAANLLAVQPEVAFAEPDMIFTGQSHVIPNDAEFDQAWGLHNTGDPTGCFGASGVENVDMNGPEAWDLEQGDPGVIVLIIDSGYEFDHPDINHSGFGADFTGEGGAGAPVHFCDRHGMTVAGCVSGIINNGIGSCGIAPNCTVASARPFIPTEMDSPCSGNWTTMGSWTVDALSWGFNTAGAKVTNNSNGYGFTSGAIETAYFLTALGGQSHFASAGNNGTTTIGYPANLASVNAISAITKNGNLAGFSDRGPGLAFCAPGADVHTTDRAGANGYDSTSDYTCVDGTSFASPYAAGVAALILSVDNSLGPVAVATVMAASAKDLGPAGYDEDFGWGIVHARGALDLMLHTDCNNNLVPDVLDIQTLFSSDCNFNKIPDECELGGCLNQYPNNIIAWASDADCDVCSTGMHYMADQLQPSSAISITGFEWWGLYGDDNAAIHDQFTIEIRADNGGQPGAAPILGWTNVPPDTKLDTGTNIGGNRIFRYTFDIGGSAMIPAGDYWVLIYNNTTESTDGWYWVSGWPDLVQGQLFAARSDTSPNGPWQFELLSLAWRLHCEESANNDCDSDWVLDECETDCNLNNEPDDCETLPEGDPSVAVEQDLCVDAMHVCPNILYIGNNIGATSAMPFFCGLYYGTQDVWYRYRPAYDGVLFVRVEGPPIYWLYAIYDGCPGMGGTEIDCNETDHFEIVINVEAGQDYYIRIASWGLDPVGSFEMNLIGPPCALNPNDLNGDGIPDECQCFADVDNSGTVDMADAAIVAGQQGNVCGVCPADVNGDGVVDATDWAIVLNSQGPCPFP